MSRSRLLVGAFAGAGALAAAAAFLQRGSYFAPSPAEQWAFVEAYCVDCHSKAEASGGLVLEGVPPRT